MDLDIRDASGFDFAHRRHRVHDLIQRFLGSLLEVEELHQFQY